MLFSVYLGELGGKNPCRISALANSNYFVALTCVPVMNNDAIALRLPFLPLTGKMRYPESRD